jgi:hypothetical protein
VSQSYPRQDEETRECLVLLRLQGARDGAQNRSDVCVRSGATVGEPAAAVALSIVRRLPMGSGPKESLQPQSLVIQIRRNAAETRRELRDGEFACESLEVDGEGADPWVELGRGRRLRKSELPLGLVPCVALIDYANTIGAVPTDSALQQLVFATVARSDGTFKVICSALLDGLPIQAAMLCRPLFEDLVVGHWLLLNRDDPNWLTDRFFRHRRAMLLHRENVRNETGWYFGGLGSTDLNQLRREQNALFQEFGGEAQRNWWDPGSEGKGEGRPVGLRGVAQQIEVAAASQKMFYPRMAGGQERLLLRMELAAQKWFSQSIHHMAMGLPVDIAFGDQQAQVLADSSDMSCFVAWWLYSQQLYLLGDLYSRNMSDLDEVVRAGFATVWGGDDLIVG